MAKKGAEDWDDAGQGKGKPAGTLALDVSKLALDDEAPGKSAGQGGKSARAAGGGGAGRSASAGRGSRADDDDDEVRGGRKAGRGARGGGEWGAAGGFSKHAGTAAIDVKGIDLDSPRPGGAAHRADWVQGGGKGRGVEDADDLPSPGRKGRAKMLGSRRDSAVKLDPEESEVESGFHDWDSPRPQPAPAGEQAAAGARTDEAPARLLVREQGKPDRIFPLNLKNRSWIVGREISCDLVLSDIKSSRQHFEISFLGGAFAFKDLGSGNGTKINGEKVGRVQLVGGDLIVVGDCELVFQLDPQALARLQEREKPARKGGAGEPEASEGGGEASPAPERLLSGAAIGLILVVVLFGLLFSGTFVAWLVFRPEKPKPVGAKVVELEEIPQSDPRLRAAEQTTARAVLGSAESFNSQGKLWDARRLAKVASLVNPSLAEARTLDGTLEAALKGSDSDACQVIVTPTNPVRGRPMTVKVALNGPVARLHGTFAGAPLQFAPDAVQEGAWAATLMTPPKAAPGSQKLELSVVDLLEETVELQREVSVR